ncbi:MAG: carboxylesterase/lipase family protein [Comamonadaceae bacterium]|nr:MAG: carboxylesterase/lipase family protein [Comamonadaceae bacterium]
MPAPLPLGARSPLPALASLLASALLAGCATGVATDGRLQRLTSAGPVVGVDSTATDGTSSWKGVPFAAPPIGALRWLAPAAPAAWTQPRPTDRFAAACVQTGRLYGPGSNNRFDATIGTTLGQTLGAEDCLYLNIWQPARPTGPRPVIVFVHGGSNITGYTADPLYDGAALARAAGAVVVTVNYRLGIFGFLDLPALKTGNPLDDSGNFALLDIVKALEFVQADIANFGGDPKRVTLMGQSAGAVNVYALLASPLVAARAQPLFHRVVGLSGGISSAASLPPGAIPGVLPRPVWTARGQALLEQSLVAGGAAPDPAAAATLARGRTPADNAAFLRATSADALLTTVRSRLAPLGMAASNPIPDGTVVAADPIAAIRAGRYTRVPVLAGITRDETKLFPQLLAIRPALGGVSGRLLDDAAVFRIAHGYDPEAPPATRIEDWVPAAYLPADRPVTGFDARTRELNRLWFEAIRDDVLNALRTQQDAVWGYRFDWDALPAPFDTLFGAAHTFDLPFVFGNFGPSLYARISFTRGNEPGRLALSQAMMQSLGAFAASGDPNAPALGTRWPAWPGRLVLDADRTQATIRAE